MRPGRRRVFDPSIPGHIAQDKLPVGLYWDRRHACWYTLLPDEAGQRRRRNVARADAKLSELVAAVEAARQAPARRPEDTPGTVAYVCALFHRSPAFRELAATTQRGYGQCRGWAVAEPTAVGPLGALQVDRLTPVIIRRLVDRIAEATPSKANAILRYLRRTWSWARERGHCRTNPAAGVKPVKERKQAKVPETSVLARAIADARERGARPRSAPGRVPPYLAIVIELAYLLRLRSIEALDITLAWETPAGVAVTRRKGSRGNLVTWTPRLRAAWQAALDLRAATLSASGAVTPLRAEDRRLILGEDGTPLRIESLRTAWQRWMRLATGPGGCLEAGERFTLHGIKHRGISDTDRAERRAGGGHVSDAMAALYDHDLPAVKPAGSE